MPEGPFALSGATLIEGPTQTGKTRLTARALRAWIDRRGTEGVVVLEFAPAVERDGELVGGRLDRFEVIPDDVWCGILDAHAPRLEGQTTAEAVDLARDNADRAAAILADAPEPRAVFVNDATIPFQHETGDVGRLTAYCDRGECAVLNAFAGTELGTADPVSNQERRALGSLRSWADRIHETA